jgi:hypothetical protein
VTHKAFGFEYKIDLSKPPLDFNESAEINPFIEQQLKLKQSQV